MENVLNNKTIIIPVNQGIAYRYIFQTDIFIELQKKAKKIILVVPEPNNEFYEDKKLYNNVTIESYKENKCKEYLESSKLHMRLKLIRNFVQNGKYDITTTIGHHKIYLKDHIEKNNPNYFGKLILLLTNLVIFIARRIKVLRKLIIYIENIFFVPTIHDDIFKKHQPDLLVVTSLGTFDYDQLFMRQARKHGTKVISVLLSWDNTTTRGMPAAYSDKVICWTEIMKQELVDLNDIEPHKINVGGVALYDYYFNNNNFYSRSELYDIFNIDRKLNLIFFATKSPNCYISNDYISQLILEAINEKRLIKECHLLVRLHPIYYRRINDDVVFSRFIEDFKRLDNKYEKLTINKPKIMSKALNYSMPESEIKLLASILRHSDLVINVFSSLNIEASIFNTPIVNVAFEGKIPPNIKKARLNIDQDLNESHNQRIVKSGGVAMAFNAQQLISLINDQLSHPSKKQQGRQNIINNESGPYHGDAGRKIAEIILNS